MAMTEQKEEFEVLDAIYGEDPKFTTLSETHFQYKYGEDGESNSFVLDIIWPESYPCIIPKFTLDAFYNSFIPQGLKTSMLRAITDESVTYIGGVQTFNMIEWVREQREALFIKAEYDQPAEVKKNEDEVEAASSSTAPKKKEQLTKSQKRREWDKKDSKGEVARGGDWVDVVKHLSQTGSQDETERTEPKT